MMRLQWSLIAGLVFALLTAIFAVINVNPVEVNVFFSVVKVPLILLILGCTLIGGIIVGSYGIYRQYKLQKQIKSLTAQLAICQGTESSSALPDDRTDNNSGFSSEQSSD